MLPGGTKVDDIKLRSPKIFSLIGEKEANGIM